MSKWENMGAGPIQCKRFNNAWSKLNWENKTFIELTGIVGQSENRWVLTGLFSGGIRPDVEAVKEKIGQRFNWQLTRDNVNDAITAIKAEMPALEANRPVQDNRQKPDEAYQLQLERRQAEEERKRKEAQKNELFTKLYGNGETVTIQPGQMAITARIAFNNSDTMSDYFDCHASYGPTFALRIVPKQAETERLARQAVESFALLAGVEFKWHTEKYSMGHGNYLQSKGFELLPELQGFCEGYRSGPVTHGHWEIEFRQAYEHPIEMSAFQGYGNSRPALSHPPGSPEYERLKARIAELEARL